jgi:hypothetical protein
MESKIKKILEKMDSLNESLQEEYKHMSEKYGFSIEKRRVIFLQKFKQRNKSFRIPTWEYVIPQNVRHILSMPFIYIMIIPVGTLDLFLVLYNHTALPLYRIPSVKREDHFIYDRQFLDYLNLIQKANCIYCSYVNGLFSFATEIGAQTERYWCPLKAAHKPKHNHSLYKYFADYGNPEEWKEKFNKVCDSKENKK